MARNRAVGLLVILLVVVLCGGILGYFSMCRERQQMHGMLEVEMPMEQAIREVEVSIWEAANTTFYYVAEPSQTALEEYKRQLVDVDEYVAKYKVLIETGKEKEMIAKFENAWAVSVRKADALIKLRDKIADVEEKAWDAIHVADDVVDYKIQAALVEGIPDLISKERAVREVEVSIWEALNATNFYLYKLSDKAKREFPAQLRDVDEFWGKYKSFDLTDAEKLHIEEFESRWSRAVELMKECNALADELKEETVALWDSVHAADDIVDFEIQECLKKRIAARSQYHIHPRGD